MSYIVIEAALKNLNLPNVDVEKSLQIFKDNQLDDESLSADINTTILDKCLAKSGHRTRFKSCFQTEYKSRKLLNPHSFVSSSSINVGQEFIKHTNEVLLTNSSFDFIASISTVPELEPMDFEQITDDNDNKTDEEFFECNENFDPNIPLNRLNINDNNAFAEDIPEGVDIGLIEESCEIYKNELISQISAFKEKELSRAFYITNNQMEEAHIFAMKFLNPETKFSNCSANMKRILRLRLHDIFKIEEEANTIAEVKAISNAQILLETFVEILKDITRNIGNEKFATLSELNEHLSSEIQTIIISFKKNSQLCPTHETDMIETLNNLLIEEMNETERSWLDQEVFKTNLKISLETAKNTYKRNMDQIFEDNKYIDPKKLDKLNEGICKTVFICLKKELNRFKSDEEKEKACGEIEICLKENFSFYTDLNLANKPKPSAWIGIDLGTTYSSVSLFQRGEWKNISVDFLSSIPSVVAYNNSTDKTLVEVGASAVAKAYQHPKTTFSDAKRLMGKILKEETVQVDKEYWGFDIGTESGKDEDPVRFIAKYPDRDIFISPEEISAQILLSLLIPTIKYLNKEGRILTGMVIGIPAGSSGQFKEATKAAVELATDRLIHYKLLSVFDMKNVKFISEPVAVVYAYRPYLEAGRKIIILDIGGGTFDITILKTGREVEVVCTSGNSHLGGQDIDNNIYGFVRKEYMEKHGIDIEKVKLGETLTSVSQRKSRLKGEIEMRKRDLSGEACPVKVKLEIGSFFPDGTRFEFLLTKEDFERVNQKFVDDILTEIKKAMTFSKFEFEEIDDVVLVGGTTNLPQIRNVIKGFFGEEKLCDQVNKELAVSFGAAFEAARSNGELEETQGNFSGMRIREVLPISVGVETMTGKNSDVKIFDIIIKKNTEIPHSDFKNYWTIKPGQKTVRWVVREGENREQPEVNNQIGEFVLEGIPPNGENLQSLKCAMSIDEKLRLIVTATCVCNGKEKEITINVNRGRISEESFKTALNRIQLSKEDDF